MLLASIDMGIWRLADVHLADHVSEFVWQMCIWHVCMHVADVHLAFVTLSMVCSIFVGGAFTHSCIWAFGHACEAFENCLAQVPARVLEVSNLSILLLETDTTVFGKRECLLQLLRLCRQTMQRNEDSTAH